jgi:hypothetical protein
MTGTRLHATDDKQRQLEVGTMLNDTTRHGEECGCDPCLDRLTPFWGDLWWDTLTGGPDKWEGGHHRKEVRRYTAEAVGLCLGGAVSGTDGLLHLIDTNGAAATVFALVELIRERETGGDNGDLVREMNTAKERGRELATEQEHDRRREARRGSPVPRLRLLKPGTV